MTPQNTAVLASLLLLFPLVGAALNGLLGPVFGRRFVNLVGPLAVLGAFVAAIVVFIDSLQGPSGASATLWTFLDLSKNGGSATNLHVGLEVTLDRLASIMLLVITGVGFLIHVYSVGYMAHDKGVARFFAYMNFFIFSMILLVVAANMVILIIGWALVALSSYLLIGFWYERPSAVLAARKAFITQVIGDVALVIGAFMIFLKAGSLSLPTIFSHTGVFSAGGAYITGACLLIAVGAFAKSAQFPLHTWLPDAMEGPTPVSALIHAATMVTAGVYLIARFNPLFALAPFAQGVVAVVGMVTALMAGIIALSQIDIKRVIAYSTMSQIGLMIYAVGIDAYPAAMFHFVTHAIFKALLFMAAGNVIHALHDEQDIRLMGGLRRRLWWTYLAFFSGSLALSGVLFAGMWSKEDLLGFGLAHGGPEVILYFIGIGVNILTGLYTFRLLFTVFHGEPETARSYAAKEAPPTMLIPVLILGALSVVAGLIQFPFTFGPHLVTDFLNPVFGANQAHDASTGIGLLGFCLGTLCSLIGIGAAVKLWEKRTPEPAQRVLAHIPRFIPLLSIHRFYFDDIYDALLVRPSKALARWMRRAVEPRVMDGWVSGVTGVVNDLGELARATQTGLIRDYAAYMLGAGIIAIFVTFLVAR